MNNIKDLSVEELVSVNGGYNIVEYSAYFLGAVVGWLADGAGNSGSNVSAIGIQH